MKHLAIFDLDGTLFDTPAAIVEGFTIALSPLDLAEVGESAIRATIGLPLVEAFAQLTDMPAASDVVHAAVRRYQEVYRERIVPKARTLLYPGVAQGLATLHGEGVTLAVATNKTTAGAEALLSAAGLRTVFAMVVGSDQVTRPKPAPEAGLLISRELDVHPDQSVMVGDTTHDLHMAHGAGMRSVAVTYGIHSLNQLKAAEPTWTADTFAEAVNLLLMAGREEEHPRPIQPRTEAQPVSSA